MSKIIIPENYTPALNLYDTQRAIGTVKRLFADTLCATLNLYRVSAPLFLEASTGLNDDLNGVERKVTFDIKDSGTEAQVVQSLAKWKRKALKDYGFRVGKGLYCDMNAIRRDEELDNLHSVYVDQWDWEKVIREEDRNEAYLKSVVRSIVSAVCATEMNLHAMFPQLQDLPLHTPNVIFIRKVVPFSLTMAFSRSFGVRSGYLSSSSCVVMKVTLGVCRGRSCSWGNIAWRFISVAQTADTMDRTTFFR